MGINQVPADWIEVRRGFGSFEMSDLQDDEFITASGLYDGGWVVWTKLAHPNNAASAGEPTEAGKPAEPMADKFFRDNWSLITGVPLSPVQCEAVVKFAEAYAASLQPQVTEKFEKWFVELEALADDPERTVEPFSPLYFFLQTLRALIGRKPSYQAGAHAPATPEWISVKDRLPTSQGRYRIVDHQEEHISQFSWDMGNKPQWAYDCAHVGGGYYFSVSHWQLLRAAPATPEGEK